MKNSKSPSGIKGKVTAGFLLLLTLIFLSVYSLIKLSLQLAPGGDPSVSSSVTKLTLTSNLLSNIIQSDGDARAFINTGDSIYLHNFNKADEITRKLIDSLTLSSISNTNQFIRIITVDSLLDLKRLTFNNFFASRKYNTGQKKVDLGKIVPRYHDTIKVSNSTISKTVVQNYPLQPEKKKGFFNKLWSGIKGKKKTDSSRVQPVFDIRYDTVLTYKAVRDTTLNQVRSQLRRFEARQNQLIQQSSEREMMLIQADQDIMNEIRAILLLYEKEEIAKAIKDTDKNRNVMFNLWTTALILAVMGLISTITFLILIWKDLARSAFYRKQLEEARALAESLLKVKEQFLANMSHEIRTPLTSIIGFSERLSETNVDKEQSRFIKYIVSSSGHLLELINDLLDFTRIGSGKLTLEQKAFNPSDLFEEAFETLAEKAKSKGLEPILRLNTGDVNLIGDPLRLKQIIINLLNNSIKFTEKGKVMLETKVTLLKDKNNALVTIRVADTGIGIPKNKLNEIFEEFSQVDHSITRRYGGSGLGLTITRKLVELMGGTINVLSREEQGTIFTVKINLPLSEHVVVQEKHLTNDIHNLSGINILIAEDDDTTRLLLKEFLEKYNAKVTAVVNGEEALTVFRKDPALYRIIITDIQMPLLSGPELISKLKEDCTGLNIKPPLIICLTAHADNSEIEKYNAEGINHFILKPFRNSDILKAIGMYDGLELNSVDKYGPDETASFVQKKSLDLSNFRKFAGNDEESLIKILTSLESNIARTSDEMVMAYNKSKFTELSVLSHRLIPNIKSLGVISTAQLLRNIELICKKDVVDELALSEIFSKCILELNRIRKQLRNSHLSAT
ncbi:MAG TPA: ATP-binding protein [Lentimicrobium sp.]|nr:ATP-binding protein [Lentimicrobium sp.]